MPDTLKWKTDNETDDPCAARAGRNYNRGTVRQNELETGRVVS